MPSSPHRLLMRSICTTRHDAAGPLQPVPADQQLVRIPVIILTTNKDLLATDGHTRSVETKIRSRTDALLRGLLYTPSGERMYPTYSRKSDGRKYFYYVSKSESRFGAPGKNYERLPDCVEPSVSNRLRTAFCACAVFGRRRYRSCQPQLAAPTGTVARSRMSSCRMRRISMMAGAVPWALCVERTIFSDAAPSRWALQ